MSDLFLGIDLGGTYIKFAVMDKNGKFLLKDKRPTQAVLGKEKVKANLKDVLLDVVRQYDVKAVGLAVAGPLDPRSGTVYNPPNLPFETFNFIEFFSEFVDLPLAINNDANYYALGEWWLGAAKGSDLLVCLTLGTGIGGGVIISGEVYEGHHGMGAELGHITIDIDGPLCSCGNRGCLEAMGSSRFIVNFVKERLMQGEASVLGTRDLESITPYDVYVAAMEKDELAVKALEMTGRNVGVGVASIVNIFDPDTVVIGGGIINAGDLIFKPMIDEFKKRALSPLRNKVNFSIAKLGEYAAVCGAVYAAIKKVEVGE